MLNNSSPSNAAKTFATLLKKTESWKVQEIGPSLSLKTGHAQAAPQFHLVHISRPPKQKPKNITTLCALPGILLWPSPGPTINNHSAVAREHPKNNFHKFQFLYCKSNSNQRFSNHITGAVLAADSPSKNPAKVTTHDVGQIGSTLPGRKRLMFHQFK